MARKTFEEIISIEPEWERPNRFHGGTHMMDVWYRWSDSPVLSIQKAFGLAQKTIDPDESNPFAHGIMAFVDPMMKQYEKAIEEGEKAIKLDPNSADAYGLCVVALHFASEPDKASSLLQRGIRLNPFPPSWYSVMLHSCYGWLGRFEEAI